MGRYAGSGAAVRSAETRGGAPEGRGGVPNELPPEERLSIMSTWRARQSSTIRARKASQNERLATFVDNVDTRARRKIHVALSFCYICRLDCSFALTRDTTVAIDNIDKSGIVPKSSRPSSFSFLVPGPSLSQT